MDPSDDVLAQRGRIQFEVGFEQQGREVIRSHLPRSGPFARSEFLPEQRQHESKRVCREQAESTDR